MLDLEPDPQMQRLLRSPNALANLHIAPLMKYITAEQRFRHAPRRSGSVWCVSFSNVPLPGSRPPDLPPLYSIAISDNDDCQMRFMNVGSGKPSAAALVSAIKSAIVVPEGGLDPCMPAVLRLAHRCLAEFDEVAAVFAPLGIDCELTTRQDAEMSCMANDTDPDGLKFDVDDTF